ncbi:MAG TPA: hypothetical protein VEF04_03220, partial [Blastocatellia bacterium]|nr:hypothetical protein [Blastocatellia bacterium]
MFYILARPPFANELLLCKLDARLSVLQRSLQPADTYSNYRNDLKNKADYHPVGCPKSVTTINVLGCLRLDPHFA